MHLPKNVRLVDATRVLLVCESCKQRWSPNLRAGGKLPRNGTKCQNGCSSSVR
jgi:hypothetical protein